MPDPRDLACDALAALEREEGFAKDALLDRRAEVTDPRDRALLTEIVYGTVRRLPTLDALLAGASNTPLPRMDPAVRAALRAGLYQAMFLARVPPHAAVDAAVRYAKEATNPRFAGLVNGVLRNLLRGVEGPASGPEDPRRDLPRDDAPPLRFRHPVFPDPAVDPVANLAVRWAHPAWLVARWLERHGAATTREMLDAGVSRPPLSLRARPGARDAVLADLRAAGLAARAGAAPDEVVVDGGEAAALAVVRDGRAAVQDGTAQRVAPLLDVRPGDRVLDLCAAPGGKALHALDLLGPRGEVVAADVSPEKVEALAAVLAARPAGGPLARAVLVPPAGPLPFPPASFHGVLVDAPCTNTGVLRRRPEARIRLREADVAALASAQRALLARAWPLVRSGGRLVYATCSVEPEENESNVEAFLADHPDARRVDGFHERPARDHDGGFAAALQRR